MSKTLPERRNDDDRPRYVIGMWLMGKDQADVTDYEEAVFNLEDGTIVKVPFFVAGSVGEITDRAKKLHNFATEQNLI